MTNKEHIYRERFHGSVGEVASGDKQTTYIYIERDFMGQ